MNKQIILIFSLTAACFIFLISAHSQEDMRSISADAFVKPRRPPAVFHHDAHNETAGSRSVMCAITYMMKTANCLKMNHPKNQNCSDATGWHDPATTGPDESISCQL